MLYEYRPSVSRSSKIKLVTKEELTNLTGFQSIYGFPPDVATKVLDQGGTWGMRSLKLYSDTLFLDIDDNDELANRIQQHLENQEIGHEMYFTGNRGYHFSIPIVPMLGVSVPLDQKRWVNHYFKGVDTSIYKTSGLIRLPGTYHTSNPGKKKVLVSSYTASEPLEIDLSTVPLEAPKQISTDLDDAEGLLDRGWLRRDFETGRNRSIYNRAFLCSVTGIDEDRAIELLLMYNSIMVSPSLPENEVIKTVRSGYRGD